MAAFPGYYTGKDGVLTFDASNVAVGEFTVKITRNVASHARSGKYSDLKKAGKVSFAGTIKRMILSGNLLECLIGTGDPSKNTTAGPISVGAATVFDFCGKVETSDDLSNIQIDASNCFFVDGGFPVGDADGIIEESLSFVMQDEDADLYVRHTNQT